MKQPQSYEVCPIHPKQHLQVVCLDCEVTSIACPLCIDLAHKNHTIISLKKFISNEVPKLYGKNPPDHQLLTKDIQTLSSSYLKLFEKMRKTMGGELNQLEKMYASEVDALQMESNVVCGVGTHLYTMQNVSLLKKKIDQKEKLPDNRTFHSRIQELCSKMEVLVGEVTEDICDIIRGLKSFWEASKELLLNSKRQFRFTFSPTLKHKALSLEVHNWKGRKIVNELYDNSYHIGAVQPPLNPFTNEVTFRIDKSPKKCIWLGLCELKKVIQRRFSNCYKRGEGGYWIWQAGCRGGAQFFSSLQAQSQSLPWNFETNDRVKVRLIYEKDSRYVEFQKNDSKIFRGKIDRSSVYCACVGMGAENEAVTIMDQ